MKKILFVFLFFSVVIFLLQNFDSIQKESDGLKSNGIYSDYKVYPIKTPDSVSFAGEVVLLKDNDLKERMDRELLVNTYWQSNMMLLIKRANKFFPIIEPILEEEGIPNDFKYLAVIESGLQNSRSPKGAKGFWQILRTTGREMGLEINNNVDERYHLELSTKAACKYLKKAKEKLGSWTLAAAAYNRGINGIFRKLELQQVDNYYDLLLGLETKRYVFRILAVKLILSKPFDYGFIFDDKDLYYSESLRSFEVDTPISNLSRFALKMGINYKILKIHNPWLIENHLNNKSRKLYNIKIPN